MSFLSELQEFWIYVFVYTFSSPAFYAAIFIPTCVSTTFHLSTWNRRFSENMRTWVEISAQIGSVVALGCANAVPLLILLSNNSREFSLWLFAIGVTGFYLYFVLGFRISDSQFNEYKERLGFALPPWGNRITKARAIGILIELLFPAYVYLMAKHLAVEQFEVPAVLSSLRL